MNLLDIFCSVNNAPPPPHTCSNENFKLIISHIHHGVCVGGGGGVQLVEVGGVNRKDPMLFLRKLANSIY